MRIPDLCVCLCVYVQFNNRSPIRFVLSSRCEEALISVRDEILAIRSGVDQVSLFDFVAADLKDASGLAGAADKLFSNIHCSEGETYSKIIFVNNAGSLVRLKHFYI